MHILGCLDRPTNGRYLLDGHDVSRLSPGEKWLLLGNHDVDHTEALQQAGFAEECTAALCCYRLASGVCRLHGGSTPRLPVSRSKALRRVGARDRDGSKRSDGLEPTE